MLSLFGYPASPQARVSITIHHDTLGRQAFSLPVLRMERKEQPGDMDTMPGRDLLSVLVDPAVLEDMIQAREEAALEGAKVSRPKGAATDIAIFPFQERMRKLMADGETWSDVAVRAGYYRRGGDGEIVPDTQRLKNNLGENDPNKAWLTEETAVTLAAALGLDPVDLNF